MTEASAFNPRPMATSEDLTLPIVVYVLYLLAVPTALLSLLIGVVIAYANRDRAGPAARSHYEFLIRTFWLSLVCLLVGLAVCVVGGLMLAGAKLWYVVRCILGIVYAARHEAYPRPDALLA